MRARWPHAALSRCTLQQQVPQPCYRTPRHSLSRRIAAGGYPAALARRTAARRSAWYRDYVETQIQRDVRDLSRLRSLDTLPRLLALAASRTASPPPMAPLPASTSNCWMIISDRS